jgi:hypothetical protein
MEAVRSAGAALIFADFILAGPRQDALCLARDPQSGRAAGASYRDGRARLVAQSDVPVAHDQRNSLWRSSRSRTLASHPQSLPRSCSTGLTNRAALRNALLRPAASPPIGRPRSRPKKSEHQCFVSWPGHHHRCDRSAKSIAYEMALSTVPHLVPHLGVGTGYHCDLSLSAGRDRMRRAFLTLVRGRGASPLASPTILSGSSSGSTSGSCSIALPYDARAVVERVLSPQPFDQEAKQCHVSPHARDR